jgi:hypothetical protein
MASGQNGGASGPDVAAMSRRAVPRPSVFDGGHSRNETTVCGGGIPELLST